MNKKTKLQDCKTCRYLEDNWYCKKEKEHVNPETDACSGGKPKPKPDIEREEKK